MGNAPGENHRLGRVSIKTIQQLRKQLTTIWNDYKSGKISTEEARTFAYLGNVLRKCLLDGDVEIRMAEIEAYIDAHQIGGNVPKLIPFNSGSND